MPGTAQQDTELAGISESNGDGQDQGPHKRFAVE